jgi:hypothetical protein
VGELPTDVDFAKVGEHTIMTENMMKKMQQLNL